VAFCGAALVARELEGLRFMMGSTMAVPRARLEEIGGFEALLDLHSDDYELGRRIAARGWRVELALEPVWMAYAPQTLGAYLRHELRWAIGIRHIRPGGHFGLLFTQGLPLVLLAAALAPSAAIAAAYLIGYAGLDDRRLGAARPGCAAQFVASARARRTGVLGLARELRGEPH